MALKREFDNNCSWLAAIALSAAAPAAVGSLSFLFLKIVAAACTTGGLGFAGALAGTLFFSVASSHVRASERRAAIASGDKTEYVAVPGKGGNTEAVQDALRVLCPVGAKGSLNNA